MEQDMKFIILWDHCECVKIQPFPNGDARQNYCLRRPPLVWIGTLKLTDRKKSCRIMRCG